MAAKLNTKFLLIVGTIVLVLIVVVGGIAVLKIRADATRHVRAAEAAESAGDLELAKSQWGRAIGKDPTNVEYMDRYEALLVEEIPTTFDEIRGSFQELLQINVQRAQARPREIEYTTQALELFGTTARLFRNPENWRELNDQASRFAVNFTDGTPEAARIQSIIVSAQGHRAAALTSIELEEAIALAERLLEADPQSIQLNEGYGYLLAQLATEQFAAGASGLAREVVAKFDAHLASLDPATRAHPFVAVSEIAMLDLLRRQGDDVTDAVADVRRRVTAAVTADDPPFELLAAAQLLFSTDEVERARAIQLLEDSIEKDEFDLLQLVLLQRLYRYTDKAKSLEVARQVIDSDPLPTGPYALFQRSQSDAFVSQIIEILFEQAIEDENEIMTLRALERDLETRISRDGDPDGTLAPELEELNTQRGGVEARLAQAVDRLLAARDELVDRIGAENDERIERANALVAMLEDRPREARAIFARIFETGKQTINTPENRFYAARAAIALDEFGEALADVEAGLRLRPGDIRLLLMQGGILTEIGRLEEADILVARLEEIAPWMEAVQGLRERLDARIADSSSGAADAASDDVLVAARSVRDAVGRGEIEQARDLAGAMLREFPEDPRSWRVRSRVELFAGDSETALATVRAGLERFPNDRTLQATEVLASTDDQITRVERMSELEFGEEMPGGPYPRAIANATLNGLLRLAEQQSQIDPELADRARGAADALLPQVIAALPPDQPALIEGLWTLLTELDRDAEAAQVVEAARTAANDPSVVVLLDARTASDAGDLERAVAVIEEAEGRRITSAMLDRVKGQALAQLGDVEGATEAFERAYERDPVDFRNLFFYAITLRDQGRGEDALGILRQSSRATNADSRIGELWLALETEIGDQRRAFEERTSRWRADPRNVQNSLGLADQLINGPVDRRDVINLRTFAELYDAGSWNRLSAQQRATLIAEARERRQVLALDVLEDLADAGAPEIAAPGLLTKARVLADLSRLAEARATLERLDENTTQFFGPSQWISVGVTAFRVDADAFGAECFARARADQEGVEVDRTIVGALQELGRADEALELARQVASHDAATDSDRLVLAGMLASRDDLDAARATFAELTPAGRESFTGLMFEATLRTSAARRAFAADDLQTTRAELERAITDLEAAAPLDPDNPEALQRMVIALQLLAQIDPESSALARAETTARRAVELRPSSWRSTLQLAETLIASDRPESEGLDEGIEVVAGYVERFPRQVEARRTLARLYRQRGRTEVAIRTLEEGANLGGDPTPWFVAMSDLQTRLEDFDGARTSARRAFEARADIETLRVLIDSLTRGTPASQELARVLTENQSLAREDPVAQAALATALAGQGQIERAEATYRRAWSLMGPERTDADALVTFLPRIHPPARAERAEALLMSASGEDPGVFGYRMLGRLWAAQGPDSTERAMERFDRAEAAAGDDPRLRAEVAFEIGSVQYARGNCAAAVAAFERSLELRPDEPSVLNNVAYLRATCLDDAEGALPAARRAVQLVPGSASFQDTLSVVLLKLGRTSEAITHARRSVEEARGSGNTLHLAAALIEAGEAAAASRELDELEEAVRRGEIDMTDTDREELANLRGRIG